MKAVMFTAGSVLMRALRGRATGRAAAALAALALAAVAAPSGAQTRLPLATFAFPSFSNVIADIIVAKGLDKANGFQAETTTYGTGGAMWAGVAKGEVFVHNIGPYQLQKMRTEGVPLALFATLESMASLQVITRDPALKSFNDLRGRTFAATVAFAEFEYLEIYAKRLGFNLRKDVQIVDATTATAQAQLAASRVDAIMAWEPSATMILQQVPGARVLVSGDAAWKSVTGHPGWELLLFANIRYIKEHPGVLPRLLKLYQDFGAFLNANPDEADAIVTSGKYASKGIPPGTIAAAIRAKRLVMDVHPAWEPETSKLIWQMMQIGFDDGHMPAMPDRESVFTADAAR